MNVVTIIGSRTWPDESTVTNVINNLPKDFTIVSGGQAVGIDGWVKKCTAKSGHRYIEGTPDHYNKNQYSFDTCPITNEKIIYRQVYNPYFYLLRNERMVAFTKKHNGLAMIFNHKHSKGCNNFIKHCKKHKLSHIIYRSDGTESSYYYTKTELLKKYDNMSLRTATSFTITIL